MNDKELKEIEGVKKGVSWAILEPQITFPEFFVLGTALLSTNTRATIIFYLTFVIIMFVRLYTNNKLGYKWGLKKDV